MFFLILSDWQAAATSDGCYWLHYLPWLVALYVLWICQELVALKKNYKNKKVPVACTRIIEVLTASSHSIAPVVILWRMTRRNLRRVSSPNGLWDRHWWQSKRWEVIQFQVTIPQRTRSRFRLVSTVAYLCLWLI